MTKGAFGGKRKHNGVKYLKRLYKAEKMIKDMARVAMVQKALEKATEKNESK